MCMWIEEFAKTCGMGVGDVGGVYICVCGQKSSLRLVGWVQGMKEVYIYIYMDRRIEEFAKTCEMGVGDEGGVYIYVYVDRRVR